jgi:TatD DNase family protein
VRLVDSHVHLDDPKFDADREAVIERALAAGVECMMAIGTGTGPPDLETAIRQAERDPFIFATVGVHPHDASKATPETFARLRQLAAHPKVLAIGEIGLDYHYDFSPRDVQQSVFRKQLEIAAEVGKPVVIHSREAWADTMALLALVLHHPQTCDNSVGRAPWPAAYPLVGLPEDTKSRTRGSGADEGVRPTWGSVGQAVPPASRGIIHCFTGDAQQARQALDLGFHLAFGGVLTFPNAGAVREAARITPQDRLLLETDCPYLAPVPHRGRRNEPSFVVEVARRLAEVRASTPDEIGAQTTRNFERLLCSAGDLVAGGLRVGPANG